MTACSIGRYMHKPGVSGQLPTYQPEQFLAILERHSQGENLLKILEEPNMPDWATFWRRCCGPAATDDLRTAYEHAQECWAERALSEVPHIADTPEEGEERTVSEGPKGVTTTVKRVDRLGHRQLRVGTRQWFAERLLQRLAERKKLTLQNPDGSSLAIQPVVNLTVLPNKSEEGEKR